MNLAQPRVVRQCDRCARVPFVEHAVDVHAEQRVSIAQAQRAIASELGYNPGQESSPVAPLARPADLGHCCTPRPHHVLDAVFGADMLRPDVGLQAENVCDLTGREVESELEDFLEGYASAAGRVVLVEALTVVEVERGVG